MKRSRVIASKKKPGRPKTTGPGEQVVVRLHPPMLGEIDKFADAAEITRAEAIRRLVEKALARKR
jgi:hypothetical protein